MIWIVVVIVALLTISVLLLISIMRMSSLMSRLEERAAIDDLRFKIEFREIELKYAPKHKKVELAPWLRKPGFPREHRAKNVLPK